MKVVITDYEGTEHVFTDVSDLFIAVKREVLFVDESNRPVKHSHTESRSWGPNLRELVKEVEQASLELQDILRGKRHGGSS